MAGHTAYNISKFGMTMVALGVASEYDQSSGITANTLWPATVVESYASINFKLGDSKYWRKATIMSDSVLAILSEPDTFTGNQLIDDTYLQSIGFTEADLVQYRFDPEVEPIRGLDPFNDQMDTFDDRDVAKRGDVRALNRDIQASTYPSKL